MESHELSLEARSKRKEKYFFCLSVALVLGCPCKKIGIIGKQTNKRRNFKFIKITAKKKVTVGNIQSNFISQAALPRNGYGKWLWLKIRISGFSFE